MPGVVSIEPVARDAGELVFARELPPDASMFECLRMAWEDARSEAYASYEAWHTRRDRSSYIVYRAAQDRADAAQDALAYVGRSLRNGDVDMVPAPTRKGPGPST
jgi:hypothetical protein